jgi:hypothetical protein
VHRSLRRRSPPPALLDGDNGDLWRLLAKTCPVYWVRAHQTSAAAAALGITEMDRLGNDAADRAASGLAKALFDTAPLAARRGAVQDGVEALHRTMAAIQEAAIAAHHAVGAPVRMRRKPKRRLFRPKRKKIKPRAPRALDLLAPLGQPLVHALRCAAGPAHPVAAEPSWAFSCQACGASAYGDARVVALGKMRCPKVPAAVHARKETLVHELIRVQGGWACARCRLAVTSSRRARAARTLCPVPEYVRPDGVPCHATRLTIQHNIAMVRARRAPRVAEAPIVVDALPPVPAPPLLAWRPHWCVLGAARQACLRCGRAVSTRARTSLSSTSCDGMALRPPAGLMAPLLGGAFDAAISVAPAAWQARAREIGWRPIARATMPVPRVPRVLAGAIQAQMQPD